MIVWFLLLFVIIVAGAGFTYRQQLRNLVEVWQETFSTNETAPADAVRGTIYDRNFKELSQTLERVSLYVRPREVTNLPFTAEQLSEILDLPESEILAAFERDSHLVWLRRDIAQVDEDLVTSLNLPGVYFLREFARTYPQQERASHLIGYSEKDQGLSGVEHYYNRLLNNDRVRQDHLPTINLQGLEQTSNNGHDLILTLDMKIQTILEKYVTERGEKMGNGRISSFLLDVVEGKIIGGANYPSYNPNSVWQHKHDALESLFLTPMVIPDVFRQFFRVASLLQGGWEQTTQIYPWSLVSGDMNFARQLRLWDRLQLSTDIHVDFSGGKKKQASTPQFVGCLAGVDCGAVPKVATPLKVLLGMSHLLNGGRKIQPHILDRIVERSSEQEYYYDAFLGKSGGRHVLPSLVSGELRTLLQESGKKTVLGASVLSGETVSLIPDYSGGQYVRDRMSLVVVSAEKPELMLLIVSRENEPGPDAEKVQGADFLTKNIRSILPSMIALQQVSQNLADMVEAPEAEEKNFKRGLRRQLNGLNPSTAITDENRLLMPDLLGMSLRKGLRLLQHSEIQVHSSGTGRIVSQSPEPGKKLLKGSTVNLALKIDTATENVLEIIDFQDSQNIK